MRTAALAVAAVPFVYPLLFMVFTAIKTQQDYVHNRLGPPRAITFENLRFAWSNGRLGHAMINSFIAVGLSDVLLVLISAAGAFWFLRHRGRISRALFAVVVGAWVLPFVIFAIPLYIFLSNLRLTNNLGVLGVVYAATNVPFGIYLLLSHYEHAIPPETREAATVDGASTFQEFRHVVFPLSRPALATLAALGFVWAWGDLLIAVLLLQDPGHYTLTVAASTLVSRQDAAVQPTAAAAVIAILPLLVVFVFAQRAITRGFTAGVGK
jgi:ABC-type glycerol-3-phosphate transport system permease component